MVGILAEDGNAMLLDARGLICPLPVLKARKLLKTAPPGCVLVVQVTDPGAPKDFEHFCAVTGVALVSIEGRDDHLEITLRQPA
jgi:tRNA 2-thiouridine synthesizing protein A